jgi:hypothetical protein
MVNLDMTLFPHEIQNLMGPTIGPTRSCASCLVLSADEGNLL